MKINLMMLLVLFLFIAGCTIKTTGNVVIEDTIKQPEDKTETTETTTTTIQEQPEETTTTTTTIPETEKTIIIENLKFVPDKITIGKGTTITWKHNDRFYENMKHMLRIYPVGDASPRMEYGESFSYTFNESGEYTIVDILYTKKNVKGKVIVE